MHNKKKCQSRWKVHVSPINKNEMWQMKMDGTRTWKRWTKNGPNIHMNTVHFGKKNTEKLPPGKKKRKLNFRNVAASNICQTFAHIARWLLAVCSASECAISVIKIYHWLRVCLLSIASHRTETNMDGEPTAHTCFHFISHTCGLCISGRGNAIYLFAALVLSFTQ